MAQCVEISLQWIVTKTTYDYSVKKSTHLSFKRVQRFGDSGSRFHSKKVFK